MLFSFNVNRTYSQDHISNNLYNPPASIFSITESRVASFEHSSELIKEVFEHESRTMFKKLSHKEDKLGFTHQKFQQYFDNIKVEFATVTLHGKNAKISNVSSSYYPIKNDFSITPQINRSQAFTGAIKHVGATSYLWEDSLNALALNDYKKPDGELVILPVIKHINETNRLAYKFDIYATSPLYRADVYIDAHTGEFIMENKKLHHADVPATGTSLYNGTVSFMADNSTGQYRLRQATDGGGIETYDLNGGTDFSEATDIVSNSNFFGGNPAGVQAHFGAEKTYKYYLENHERNSFDDEGTVIKSYVSFGLNIPNAYWTGSAMLYGDGDGVQVGPVVSLDIAGHEITHGVIQFSANLVYSYESGALNESFADIFGENVEKYAQDGNHDWLIGDHLGIGGSGGAFRSMSNPNAFSNPDTYNGTYWWTSSGDFGGVHINSGVQNFWFYLLSEGGNGTNDIGQSYSVDAIGMTKAAAIAYRNLTVYLSANSQYADARAGAIQAAIDLYGAGSAEEIATTNAWHAVGIGAAYDGGNGGDTCDGVPEWQSDISYNVGDRVTYQGNLFELTANGWIFIMECPVVTTDPCAGVSEWQAGTSYNVGDRVTYQGNLFELTINGWIFIQACEIIDPCAGVAEWQSGTTYNIGDRVTYLGNLFELTTNGWVFIQACGANISGENTNIYSFSPPENNISTLKIYPNPIKGNIVNLEVFGTTPTEYIVYNYIGQIVMKGAFASTIDVSQLDSGIYIVQLNSEDGKLIDRFIKN